MKNCLNCQATLPETVKFCPNCGQKNTDGKVSVTEFFRIFFDTYFNVDSSIFRTAIGLFIPGRLTKQFFEGKHKSFLHPMRIFLLTAAFFIAVLGFQINGFLSEKADNMSKAVLEYYTKSEVLNQIDSIQSIKLLDKSSCVDTALIDTLRSQLHHSNIFIFCHEAILSAIYRQNFYKMAVTFGHLFHDYHVFGHHFTID